jgi:hypothetical protein
MRVRTHWPAVTLLSLLVITTAACGTSSVAEPSRSSVATIAQPTPAPSPKPRPSFPPFDHGQIPAEIVGDYSFTVYGKPSLITLESDGTYVLSDPISFGFRPAGIEGEYGVFGDRMRFGNEYVAGSGRACVGDGEYEWSFDGERLSLTLIEDECALDINRQAEWQSGWTRVD